MHHRRPRQVMWEVARHLHGNLCMIAVEKKAGLRLLNAKRAVANAYKPRQTAGLWSYPDLVREERHNGKVIHVCNCGLGYDDVLIAYACEEYARTHGVNSEDIVKRAVYNPRTERLTKRTIAP